MAKANRRTRRMMEKLAVEAGDVELNCSCGWPLPLVRLAFDPKKQTPAFESVKELLRGAAILIDCPNCDRVHEDPLGFEDDGPAGPQKAPIRGIPCTEAGVAA